MFDVFEGRTGAEGMEKVAAMRKESEAILGNKGLIYKVLSMPPAHREVSQTRPNESGGLFVGLPRHWKPMREAVHWSVLKRINGGTGYQPQNIFHDTFWPSVFEDSTPTDTDIVGEDERFLEWWRREDDYRAMLKILPEEQIAEFEKNVLKQKEW